MTRSGSIKIILALGALVWACYFGLHYLLGSGQITAPSSRDAGGENSAQNPLAAKDAASGGWFDQELARFQSYPHLDKAYRLLNEKQYGGADEEFQKYLEIKPNDQEARLAYAAVLYAQKRYRESLNQSGRVLRAAPRNVKALLYAGLCRKELGCLDKSLHDFQSAASLMKEGDADLRLARLAQADILTQLGRPEEALPLFQGLAPDASSEFIKGLTLLALGRASEAAVAFSSSLDLSETPEDKVRALRALAETDRKSNNFKRAIANLQKALALEPENPALTREIGQLAYAGKDYTLAADMARKTLALSDDHKDREFLANVLVASQDYDAAAKTVREMVESAPDDAAKSALSVKLGDVYAKAGKDEKAVKAFEQAVDFKESPLALVRLARIEERLGRDEEAVDAYERALSLSPNPGLTLSLASLLARTKHADKAIALAQEALKNLPEGDDRRRALRMLGALFSEAGRNQEAAASFEEALVGAKDDPELLRALGETDMRLERYDQAAAYFSKSLAALDDLETRLALAEAYDKAEKLPLALATLEEALAGAQEDAQKAPILERMANLNFRLGKAREAGRRYLEAYAAGAASGALIQAGRSFAAARSYDKASKAFALYLDLGDVAQMDKAEVLHSLGYVQAAQGRYDQAASSFQKALALGAGLPGEKIAAIRIGLSEAYMKTGRAAEAVKVLRAIALKELPAAGQATALLALGQAYSALNEFPAARDAFARAAGLAGLSAPMRADIFENLGYAALAVKDLEMAEAAFRRALSSGSQSGWRIRYALGDTLYRMGKYREALEQLQASLRDHYQAKVLLVIAQCWMKIGKPGLAVYFLELAMKDQGSLAPDEQRLAKMTLGYLFADEFRYAEAAGLLRQALAMGDDPSAQVRLARLERLTGEANQAVARLLAVPPDSLDQDMRAFRLDELSADSDALDDYEGAVKAMEEAIAMVPNAERYFRLGKIHADRKKLDPAIAAYRKAVELSDENRYLTALGYALNDAGKLADAAVAFEKVVERDEDYLNLWQDLGYIYMHECDNKKAVDRFKKAIDNKKLYPVDNKEQAEQIEKDNYRLRKEVSALSTSLTATAYVTYVSGKAGPPAGAGGEGADVIRSNSGVEVNYIPPVIGFRDKRIFQLVGRVNWNLKKDSLQFDADTYQGAFGIRYKPFKDINFHVGLERLFKIGNLSEENWLARALGSWTDGYEVKPGEPWWNYTFTYGEYDYYIDSPARSMFYGEFRQGVTFNYGDRFLVTPHLVADARVWAPDRNHSSLYEGGLGLSLKYLFNEPDYEVYRSYLELLVHYKLGMLYNRTEEDGDKDINALFVSGILHF